MQELSGETPIVPHEESANSDPMHSRAEVFVQSHTPEGDDVAREHSLRERMRVLDQAYGYLYGTGDNNHAKKPSLEQLHESDWEEIEELADLIGQVNGMKWHLENSRQNFKARRDDGSEVSIPHWWLDDANNTLKLREVTVNARDGYTLADVLRTIIDPTHSPSYKKVQAMLEKLDQQENGS